MNLRREPGRIHLRFFSSREFRGWWPDMDLRLLFLEDVLRFRWGDQIEVSPHPNAIGRRRGASDGSWHNVDAHDAVFALDQFPHWVRTRGEAERFVELAEDTGFTGIGVYPDWKLGGRKVCGFHLDSRLTADPGAPAKWGGADDGEGQYYVTFEQALERLPDDEEGR